MKAYIENLRQSPINILDDLQQNLWLNVRRLFIQHDIDAQATAWPLAQKRLDSDLYSYLQNIILKKIDEQISILQKEQPSSFVTSADIKIHQLQTVRDGLIDVATKKAKVANPAMTDQQFTQELKQDLINHLEMFAIKVKLIPIVI